MLITNFTNVTYLTGFTGDDSYLIVWREGELLLSDPRYTEQLGEECPDLELGIRPPGTTIRQFLAAQLRELKFRNLAIEAGSMTVALRDYLAKEVPQLELVSTTGQVETLREIKDSTELAEIRQAIEYAERSFAVIRASLRPSLTEREIGFALEQQIRVFGGRGCSFPPIVAAGPRSALPHARPTGTVIGEHGLLLIDWGAQGRLYMSDLTRVLVTGKIPPKLERIYGVVLTAQRAAIRAIKPGALMKDVDAAARDVIAKAGYASQFGHGLGHGFGLEIHENPRLASYENRPLKAGMVVTVEPGIYIPKWGGVRIEDDVLVTRKGCEVLSGVPKELADCVVV